MCPVSVRLCCVTGHMALQSEILERAQDPSLKLAQNRCETESETHNSFPSTVRESILDPEQDPAHNLPLKTIPLALQTQHKKCTLSRTLYPALIQPPVTH